MLGRYGIPKSRDFSELNVEERYSSSESSLSAERRVEAFYAVRLLFLRFDGRHRGPEAGLRLVSFPSRYSILRDHGTKHGILWRHTTGRSGHGVSLGIPLCREHGNTARKRSARRVEFRRTAVQRTGLTARYPCNPLTCLANLCIRVLQNAQCQFSKLHASHCRLVQTVASPRRAAALFTEAMSSKLFPCEQLPAHASSSIHLAPLLLARSPARLVVPRVTSGRWTRSEQLWRSRFSRSPISTRGGQVRPNYRSASGYVRRK